MKRLSERPLFAEAEIRARTIALAREISRDYAGKDLVLVSVLKGATVFASDLLRALTIPATLEFLRAKSYSGTQSTDEVRIHQMPEEDLAGRHVLLVEDILDTGQTIAAVIARLRELGPATIEVCVLLNKPHQRKVEVSARYVAFELDPATHADELFVVGYGLDYNESYRGLKEIFTLHEH